MVRSSRIAAKVVEPAPEGSSPPTDVAGPRAATPSPRAADRAHPSPTQRAPCADACDPYTRSARLASRSPPSVKGAAEYSP